ncbi:MAG: DNA-binding protein [Acetobacterium sp. MES1]|uniref:helix-turn-helix domain-containing protein n=1 Tax=Acetobacterium sp. MES1 TaxID=1899015 RepID=UPI000B9D37FE|nr:XRE family transcriptional regulator [Acetobacterium sp. MES1]OXS26668.1 MAG: DNA-binding protein [Acetobacterium sp. MES1]
MDITLIIGKNIKEIREAKKLTLDAAARETGVSRSMLAQIEKGDVNPTISVLWKIANGYKISFSSLLNLQSEETMVILAQSVTPLVEDDGKYINYPVFPFDEKKLFETYRIEIVENGQMSAQPHIQGTEEYVTVFEGAVEISVGAETFRLEKGDSIRFKADVPHAYRNMGITTASLSMIIYYSEN